MVAAAPLIGLALTAGGAAMQYSAASAANRARENATKQWLSYQKQKARVQNAKDEANRSKAQAAQEATLNKLGASAETVGNETQRLVTDLNAGNTMEAAPEATVNNALLSGQGGNLGFKEYAAKQLNKAAKDARNRTAALASVQAYTGSQFGLQNTNSQAVQEGNNWIDLYNNNRKGDLAVYGLAKGIQPLQVGEASGGMGNALAQLGGSLAGMGGGGGGLSSIF
jgi:hypothetical protein